ncbi:MAG: ABC transporter permease [Anaerolineales bacterium]|nr:ABC transporter permease [Anaerolineales bacterium]
MKRFWILFSTELKAWRHDPITAVGGFVPTVFMLLAFGLLFGGRLAFKIGVIDQDQGPYGAVLQASFAEVISPFGSPYYDVQDLTAAETWAAYERFQLEGVWIIPADFSERIAAGEQPSLEMVFTNYNDDRAKNHRIYAAEILWYFYEQIGYPQPPLALAEEYPRPQMVEWFPVIAVGVALLGFMIGGMMNVFMLTYKEQTAGVTLEFGLAPRSLVWVLLPKTLLALLMSLLTGTALLLILYLWPGVWPGAYLPAVWLLAVLVVLFWVPLTLALGLRAQYFAGAIAVMLTAITVFFIGGGLALVRANEDKVPWFSWLFPNIYAVDPLRDLILFHHWPVDWTRTVGILTAFAVFGLLIGWGAAARQIRRLG